ncbi:hypothetical protein P378_18595 [Desulforamulus profundi]|uniref:Transposase InsH N-terminal domain-containing protein n=1 Tax=Desulforamulus profundi TaxID=1383067 RepID=A0A2C6MC02_9FIRM|nr:hypothetical protein [Desulforamulus profundi]PHJ37064.1 hypothetical protein P378_18595 [Desulforamulus profundi]
MLSLKYSHTQYQNFVHSLLSKFYLDTHQQITLFTNFPYIAKLWHADLTAIVPLIRNYYSSSTQGAPPKDAVAMLHSLLLMAFKGVTSIPAWIDTLRSDPFFAILSGFIYFGVLTGEWAVENPPWYVTWSAHWIPCAVKLGD